MALSHIQILQRREKWLDKRIKDDETRSYDRAERNALRAAISMIEHHKEAHPTCNAIAKANGK